jgi:hypothetical protein
MLHAHPSRPAGLSSPLPCSPVIRPRERSSPAFPHRGGVFFPALLPSGPSPDETRFLCNVKYFTTRQTGAPFCILWNYFFMPAKLDRGRPAAAALRRGVRWRVARAGGAARSGAGSGVPAEPGARDRGDRREKAQTKPNQKADSERMLPSARTNPNKSCAVLFHKPPQNPRSSALQTKACGAGIFC